MSLSVVLAGVALAASILLIVRQKARTYGIIAAVAAALDLAVALNLIRVTIPGIGLSVITGGVVAVVGVLVALRVEKKPLVVAATCVAMAGAIELLLGLGVLHR